MSLNSSFKDWMELKKQVLTLQTEFLKHLLTVASAVLAILISLRATPDHNSSLFQYSLLLLLLCILFGIASLYLIVYQHRKMDKELQERIAEQIRDQAEHYKPVYSKYNKLLKFFETICIFSFLAAMIILVYYKGL